jgi:hypothetical protein
VSVSDEIRVPDSEVSEASEGGVAKKAWSTPQVKAMRAGAAEFFAGATFDAEGMS